MLFRSQHEDLCGIIRADATGMESVVEGLELRLSWYEVCLVCTRPWEEEEEEGVVGWRGRKVARKQDIVSTA